MTTDSTSYHRKWDIFAATFPHQAFLMHQLKAIHDNLLVVLRLLSDKQKNVVEPCFNTLSGHHLDLDYSFLHPFEYFQMDQIDLAHRRVFLELFISLATERKHSSRAVMWRELGRSILDHAYEAERAALVAEITSSASADALSAVCRPGMPDLAAGVWSVRREIVVRENALQKSLARLRELLKENESGVGSGSGGGSSSSSKEKTVGRSVEFESRRAPSRERVVERRRLGERSPERGIVPGPPVFNMNELLPLPERRRRRPTSPPVSDEDSAEMVEKDIEDA
jgi:hypothetical protein